MCLQVRLCVVASITTTASITAVNATCRRWLEKAPERSLLNNLAAAGGHIVFHDLLIYSHVITP